MASSLEHPQTPTFTDLNLTYPPSLEHYNIPAATWLMKNAKSWDGLATSALVFSPSTTCSKILLVQRTAHDSMPLLWETPGGGVDPDDTSLLVACARELWEETGLQAVEFVRVRPNEGLLPRQWRHAKIIPLKKPNKSDYGIATAWRSISLLSTLGKVLESVLAERISHAVETFGLLPMSHFGAR
ncbi:NUDIX domain-containing protein [Colletotrichum abscissum]|uniref:NUDIX domain-containing protein n=1 Tax=Colletotrichum abscissum TaxID=1671311 RepID=UPI0027D6A893|nr:NUDIX domain-containing protein [Colletotrichum abscissum]KAK1471627.1 NUDIX domain-containing protein [Colletotrichum abscissum]